ncbi:MAG: PAS domain-containing hybrid sensor histidine kinase/response regulator [Spirochaetota bacterium]
MQNTVADHCRHFLEALTEPASIIDGGGNVLLANRSWANWRASRERRQDGQAENILEHAYAGQFKIFGDPEGDLEAAIKAIDAGLTDSLSRVCEYGTGKRREWITLELSAVNLPENRLVLLRIPSARQPETGGNRTQESLYRTLLEDMPVPMSICDSSFEFVWVNRRFRALFGLKRSDLIGKHIDETDINHALPSLRNLLRSCLLTGKEEQTIADLTIGKKKLVVDQRVIPVPGVDGKIEFAIAATVDISRQVRIEEARSAAYNLLNELIQNVPVGLVITDEVFHVLRINASARQLFGKTVDDVVGAPILDLIPANLLADREIDIRNLAESGGPHTARQVSLELHALHADGSKIPVLVSALELKMGEYPLYCFMILDLTAVRQAESKLRESEAQMLQMQKQEALGQLAGNIAHDFNNLLAIIRGYSDLMTEIADLPASARPMAEEISRAVQRGAALTRQILAYAKHQALDVRLLDLNRFLLDNRLMLEAALTPAVSIRFELAAAESMVFADENQLTQVLLNLAVNARDAMPTGGVFSIGTQVVRLSEEFFSGRGISPQVGEYLCIRIRDTGQGISSHLVDRIFDPYFSTKGREKGTGLGLSVVYGIIKQHKGFVFCDSVIGQGTVFSIYLPLTMSKVQNQPPQPDSILADRAQGMTGAKVLLVEDESALRRVIKTYLEEAGLCVFEAASAKEALAFVEGFSGNLDLVLTDIVMPGMNGLEFADEARLLQSDAPFIFMSGYSENALKWHEAGRPFKLLQKPFKRQVLIAEVIEVLRRRQEVTSQ